MYKIVFFRRPTTVYHEFFHGILSMIRQYTTNRLTVYHHFRYYPEPQKQIIIELKTDSDFHDNTLYSYSKINSGI